MPLLTGHPCPTCGMTTSFAYAVRGRLLRAFHAQPAGLAIALGLFGVGAGSLTVVISGRVPVLRSPVRPALIAASAGLILFFGWAYKIMTFSP